MKETVRVYFEKYRSLLIFSYVVAFIAYGFLLTNKLVSHDEANNVIGEWMWPAQLGRFSIIFIKMLLPIVSNPWVYGLLAVTFLALAAAVLCELFQIKQRCCQYAVAFFLIATPLFASVFYYMYTAPAYALAVLLSAIIAYLVVHHSTDWWAIILSVVLLVATIGIYQAYVSFVATLLLLAVVVALLDNRPLGHVGIQLAVSLGVLALSLIGYVVVNQLFLSIWQLELVSYQNVSGALSVSVEGIGSGILQAYGNFWATLTQHANGFALGLWMQIAYGALLVVSILVLTVLLLFRVATVVHRALVVALLALLPMSICLVLVLNDKMMFYSLTAYAYCLLPIFSVVLVAKYAAIIPLGIVWRVATAVLVTWLAVQNIFVISDATMRLAVTYEQVYALMTTVVGQVRSTPGYTANTKVALVGATQPQLFEEIDYRFPEGSRQIAGSMSSQELASSYSRGRFLAFFTGAHMPLVEEQEFGPIVASEQFAAMPQYPDAGSIAWIDDVLVVKFSDPTAP